MAVLAGMLASGCASDEGPRRETLTVMVPASERAFWSPIAAGFEAAHPGLRVDVREGPNDTDLRENLYTAALLAADQSLDLVYMDVPWTAKFAAAGWLLPLEGGAMPSVGDFLPATVESGRYRGRLYRFPLRADAGLLYYRADLLRDAGLAAPRTFDELARVGAALASPPERWAFAWQGAQYEGLVGNYLEVLRGHGGFWIDDATLAVGLDRPEARAALGFLLRTRTGGLSPPGVTTYKEEESRRLFQDGRAVFLRNWTYVYGLSQRDDSGVAGRVGVAPMVHAPGGRAAATLGGWGLGISRFSRRPADAAAFIRHAATLESQRALCLPTGFAPARRDAYRDPALLAANPFLAEIEGLLAIAVARPAIPRYALASDILQRRLSAALAGTEDADGALAAAADETRRLLGPVRGGEGGS